MMTKNKKEKKEEIMEETVEAKECPETEVEEVEVEEAPIPIEVSILDADLEKLQNDAKDFKDKYLRTLAETENARKRLQKEKEGYIKYAIENLVLDLLNPLDQMGNALGHAEKMSPEIQHWATGFQMIYSQLTDTMAQHGVKPFHSEGKMFDPHLHEAVETVETEEYPEGTIIKEFSSGYSLGERTIRPAKVKVTKKPQAGAEEELKEESSKQ
jgi:molecular chaperone GrpE